MAIFLNCVREMMMPEEFIEYVCARGGIEKEEVEAFLKAVEEQKPDFFRMYWIRAQLASQIRLYNILLLKQAKMYAKSLVSTQVVLTTDLDSSLLKSVEQAKRMNPHRTPEERQLASLVRVLPIKASIDSKKAATRKGCSRSSSSSIDVILDNDLENDLDDSDDGVDDDEFACRLTKRHRNS